MRSWCCKMIPCNESQEINVKFNCSCVVRGHCSVSVACTIHQLSLPFPPINCFDLVGKCILCWLVILSRKVLKIPNSTTVMSGCCHIFFVCYHL